jgi:hypothetical protein
MKRIIWLAAAAALLAAWPVSAEGEDDGAKPYAATARFEQIWPAAGFDYTFANRISLGPVVKYDGAKFVAAAESRVYIRADHGKPGIQPYVVAEGGWQTGTEPPDLNNYYWWTWPDASGGGTDGPAEEEDSFHYRYYAFAGPGVDLRAKNNNFVPFVEIGPRREFREGNQGVYLYWALGLRYTW